MKTKKLQLPALLVLLMTLANFNLAIGQNMNRYIELTVTPGKQIRLKFQAGEANTSVKVVSGTYSETLKVGTDWTDYQKYTAGASTMTVYGDITGFNCEANFANITSLDASHNTTLEKLLCNHNQLITLDLSQNKALKWLICEYCQLTSLNVSQNKELETLHCYSNELTSLDLSQNKELIELICNNNPLSALDLSQNKALKWLTCINNQLTSLDLSQNTELEWLDCYSNNFTTQAIDDIYCSLPLRQPADNARIFPVSKSTDTNHALVLATNKQNAIDKGWKVQYSSDYTDIPATTGTYTCPPVSYGIRIGGNYLTEENAGAITNSNFPNLGLTAGTITYDHSTKTFTLTDVVAQATTLYDEFIDITENAANATYTIELIGNNKVVTNRMDAIQTSKNLIIQGSGSLQVFGRIYSSAIMVKKNATLSIKNTTVETSGASFGIAGETGTNSEKLVIENSTVKAKGKEGSIYGFQKIALTECKITAPAGAEPATNGSDGMAIMLNGTVVKEQVVIEPTSPVNMSRYIELTVKPGSNIWFALYAQQSDTPVKIVSGTAETRLRAIEDWIELTYIAQAGTIRIYGDVAGFDCGDNEPDITGLDVSHNTALEHLSCYGNQLTTLNLSKNTALKWLSCEVNQLTSLDVSQNTALKELSCNNNQLTSLDVSQNTALIELFCDGNNFTTRAIDDIYCSLPQRQPADNAKIYPVDNPTDINHALVLATNKQNAVNKGWRVLYWDDTDIPATTGSYVCGTGIESVESTVSIYPNPVRDILNIKSDNTIESLELYDALGRLVLSQSGESATESTLNVSSLTRGIYILQLRTAGGIAKYKVVVSK